MRYYCSSLFSFHFFHFFFERRFPINQELVARAHACDFFCNNKLYPCFCPCELIGVLIGRARSHVNVYILMCMSLHLNAHVYSQVACGDFFTGVLAVEDSTRQVLHSLSLSPAHYHMNAKSTKNESARAQTFPN